MLRSLAGKTQEDIAEVIGISRQAYAKWERGETIPDIEKCGRLAEFYGVTMDSLIKDDVQLEGQKMAPAPKGKHEGTEKVDYTVYIWYNVSIKYRRCFYDRTTAEIDAKSIHGNI